MPTCSICLSKIRILDLRVGSRGRKLLCKHVFHAACIDGIYKPQCPLCQHPIFNRAEEALLTCTSEEAAVDILKSIHERDINVKSVFTFLTAGGSASAKHQWIVDLMYKYCDFTELLADNLNDKTFVRDIVERGKVNWFKTFYGGLTFLDLVHERTDDPEIIVLVHAKLPMVTDSVDAVSQSPRRGATCQRHGPTDGTLRRSACRSLYPSLMTCEESLYPAVPSAPPIEYHANDDSVMT